MLDGNYLISFGNFFQMFLSSKSLSKLKAYICLDDNQSLILHMYPIKRFQIKLICNFLKNIDILL